MNEEREGKSRVPVVAASVFFLIPCLYILSIGPAVRIVAKTGKREHHEICWSLYRPLLRVVAHFPILERALNDYTKLWVKYPFRVSQRFEPEKDSVAS